MRHCSFHHGWNDRKFARFWYFVISHSYSLDFIFVALLNVFVISSALERQIKRYGHPLLLVQHPREKGGELHVGYPVGNVLVT